MRRGIVCVLVCRCQCLPYCVCVCVCVCVCMCPSPHLLFPQAGVEMNVTAPFYKDPAPSGTPGEPFYGLWEYEGESVCPS